jgi:hypothetical protein
MWGSAENVGNWRTSNTPRKNAYLLLTHHPNNLPSLPTRPQTPNLQKAMLAVDICFNLHAIAIIRD